jgi:hypothetical protein
MPTFRRLVLMKYTENVLGGGSMLLRNVGIIHKTATVAITAVTAYELLYLGGPGSVACEESVVKSTDTETYTIVSWRGHNAWSFTSVTVHTLIRNG